MFEAHEREFKTNRAVRNFERHFTFPRRIIYQILVAASCFAILWNIPIIMEPEEMALWSLFVSLIYYQALHFIFYILVGIFYGGLEPKKILGFIIMSATIYSVFFWLSEQGF